MDSRKEALKTLIKRLHDGADPKEVKETFKEVLADVTPPEIARVEQELIQEGMPSEEIRRLCDVHLAVFQESLDSEEHLAPAGHPIHILMEEHSALLRLAGELFRIAGELRETGAGDDRMKRAIEIKEDLQGSENHYVREENVIFPYLEKHGITQPPAIMWMEHDQIREVKKSLYALVEAAPQMEWRNFVNKLAETALSLNELLQDHFQKENQVLFPTALRLFAEGEWTDARLQFDELGYCPFTPKEALVGFGGPAPIPSEPAGEGEVIFETGVFSTRELEALLDALPVEITFVDANDSLRYFNQPQERVFPRSKAAIGRTVQLCHPQKSLPLVNRILQDFRSGQRDVAEFWIQRQGMFVHIRYFAVRDREGTYLGTLEVVQELSRLRALEGERRLPDDEG